MKQWQKKTNKELRIRDGQWREVRVIIQILHKVLVERAIKGKIFMRTRDVRIQFNIFVGTSVSDTCEYFIFCYFIGKIVVTAIVIVVNGYCSSKLRCESLARALPTGNSG